MTYTYDVKKIVDHGVDRMRLELGDAEVEGGTSTCALSDEEYAVLIDETYGAGKTWKQAQYRCLQVIVSRMAMMIDLRIDGLEMHMNERYDRWLRMLRSKEELFKGICAPQYSHLRAVQPVMHRGMHDNPRAMGGIS